MRFTQIGKATIASTSFVAIIMAGYSFTAPSVKADDSMRIQQGFAIAPVPLNLAGKDPALVGLGSYLVNAVGDCNGCHSSGPQQEYTPNGNPYLLPPIFGGKTQVNPATYLGGGRDFGNLGAGSDIVSRNLTPDKTGMAEGGHTFAEFLQIMRTGVDMDQLHPSNCSAIITTNCVPFPFNPSLLQIMPWPNLSNMSDNDLLAIYTYLSAIPCITGPATGVLHNDCGTPTGPGPLTVITISLPDGTVGTAYSQLLSATGGMAPYMWKLTSGRLPLGLVLDPLTGKITGTPTVAVTGTILQFQVTDASTPTQTATATLKLVIQ
jgi:hypothetical protein